MLSRELPAVLRRLCFGLYGYAVTTGGNYVLLLLTACCMDGPASRKEAMGGPAGLVLALGDVLLVNFHCLRQRFCDTRTVVSMAPSTTHSGSACYCVLCPEGEDGSVDSIAVRLVSGGKPCCCLQAVKGLVTLLILFSYVEH